MSTTISKEMKLDGLALDAALDAADDAYFAEGEENLSFKKAVLAAIRVYVDETSKPVAEAVKVKPLQWRDGRNAETVFDVVQHATILGAEELVGLEYTILGPDRHGLFEVILGDKIINFGNSEEQAKVVAQLDYQRRIMSALSTPPQPEAQGEPPCPCTLIEQDETCPVGYPSLLCEECDGKGHLFVRPPIDAIKRLRAYATGSNDVKFDTYDATDVIGYLERLSPPPSQPDDKP
jgi:hypothetical protein